MGLLVGVTETRTSKTHESDPRKTQNLLCIENSDPRKTQTPWYIENPDPVTLLNFRDFMPLSRTGNMSLMASLGLLSWQQLRE